MARQRRERSESYQITIKSNSPRREQSERWKIFSLFIIKTDTFLFSLVLGRACCARTLSHHISPWQPGAEQEEGKLFVDGFEWESDLYKNYIRSFSSKARRRWNKMWCLKVSFSSSYDKLLSRWIKWRAERADDRSSDFKDFREFAEHFGPFFRTRGARTRSCSQSSSLNDP
jgi:hypothetical protein